MQLKCAWYVLYQNRSRPNQHLERLPQKCEMGKFSATGGVLVSQRLWMSVQTARVKPLPFQEENQFTSTACRWTHTPKRHPAQWQWATGAHVPGVLLLHALPVGQAALSSQLACGLHQPVAPLPASTAIREKDLWTGAVFTESPELCHSSWEGLPDPRVQQERAGMLQRPDSREGNPIHPRYAAERSNYHRCVQHACLFAALYHTLYNSLQESILPLIHS